MLTDLKTSMQSIDATYKIVQVGKYVYVAQSLFVIAKIKMVSERKFTVTPLNILGLFNIYVMQGKYHFYYKMLEDDIIYALKQYAGRNSSVILG